MNERSTGMHEAGRIGGRAGLTAALAGLLLAQGLMMILLTGELGAIGAFFWPFALDVEMSICLLVGLCATFLAAWGLGILGGRIIWTRPRGAWLVGPITGLSVLLLGAWAGSLTGYFVLGSAFWGTNSDPAFDFLVKPMYWITIFGFLPAMLIGLWYGLKVRSKINADQNGLDHTDPEIESS